MCATGQNAVLVFEEETGDGLNPFRLQDTPGRQPFFRREHHLPGQSSDLCRQWNDGDLIQERQKSVAP